MCVCVCVSPTRKRSNGRERELSSLGLVRWLYGVTSKRGGGGGECGARSVRVVVVVWGCRGGSSARLGSDSTSSRRAICPAPLGLWVSRSEVTHYTCSLPQEHWLGINIDCKCVCVCVCVCVQIIPVSDRSMCLHCQNCAQESSIIQSLAAHKTCERAPL